MSTEDAMTSRQFGGWKQVTTLLQAALLFGSQSQMLQLCDRCKTLIIKSVFTFFRFLLKQQPEEQQKINT